MRSGVFRVIVLCVFPLQPLYAEKTSQSVSKAEVEIVQSAKALALDNQLAREMKGYQVRYRKFRHNLRSKYSKGKDRIAALEKWEADHELWNKSWETRKKQLEGIWNWGPDGKPKAPERVEDLSTASGRVAVAIRKIRAEEKGTGKAGDRIARWMEQNKVLAKQAEAEHAAPPAPEDNRQFTGMPEEIELGNARKELQRIRKELLSQGKDALKAAMKDPDSAYSKQKKLMIEKDVILQKNQLQTAKETSTGE